MGVEEVWTNRNLNAADPDFTYSPLIRLNGTMYDKLIADIYFGFAPLGKMLPEEFVDFHLNYSIFACTSLALLTPLNFFNFIVEI